MLAVSLTMEGISLQTIMENFTGKTDLLLSVRTVLRNGTGVICESTLPYQSDPGLKPVPPDPE